jgi:hypothetical protein
MLLACVCINQPTAPKKNLIKGGTYLHVGGKKQMWATGWISAALLTTTTNNNNTTTPQIDSAPIPIMSQASHWMEIYHQAAIQVPSSSHLCTIKQPSRHYQVDSAHWTYLSPTDVFGIQWESPKRRRMMLC